MIQVYIACMPEKLHNILLAFFGLHFTRLLWLSVGKHIYIYYYYYFVLVMFGTECNIHIFKVNKRQNGDAVLISIK
jgi:hypothetical protein